MNRLALAAVLVSATPLVVAQAPAQATSPAAAVPAINCGATPEYPGRLGSNYQKQAFDKAYKVYDKCVRQYVEDRKSAIEANSVAAQKAIDEFNSLATKMRADSGEYMTKGEPKK